VLGAFLRMGTKYGVPYFRRLATAKLTAIYPSTLAGYYAISTEDPGTPHVQDYHHGMAYMALSLARECGVSAITPCCLWYAITPIDGSEFDKFYDNLSFESEDGRVYCVDTDTKLQCVKAGWALETERITFLAKHVVGRGHTPKCDQSCLRSPSQHLMLEPSYLPLFLSPAGLRERWTEDWELCSPSAREAEKKWSTRMEELWTKLPSYYGLAPWEELIATSQ
jgi:hypothetical protein